MCFNTLIPKFAFNYANNEANTHPWEDTGFVDDHMNILTFSWHLLSIMPVDVPILAEMNVHHFFGIYLLKIIPCFLI